MNFPNFIEDARTYLRFQNFQSSCKKFEYFDVSYYFLNGHYRRVMNLNDLELLNTRKTSLIKYFNYLIYIFLHDRVRFEKEKHILTIFLETLKSEVESRHHVYLGGHIYLKNDFETHGLSRGWIGALPHIRLMCLLSLTGEEEQFRKQLLKSVFARISPDVSEGKYCMINPITSFDNFYRFHEYPKEHAGANAVINCNLLAYSYLADIECEHSQFMIPYLDELCKRRLFLCYSEDESNPITPAYLQLQSSIVRSGKLRFLSNPFIEVMLSPASWKLNAELLVKKILFRAIHGYK